MSSINKRKTTRHKYNTRFKAQNNYNKKLYSGNDDDDDRDDMDYILGDQNSSISQERKSSSESSSESTSDDDDDDDDDEDDDEDDEEKDEEDEDEDDDEEDDDEEEETSNDESSDDDDRDRDKTKHLIDSSLAEKFDEEKFHKLLNNLFPSRYMKNKVNNYKKKRLLSNSNSDSDNVIVDLDVLVNDDVINNIKDLSNKLIKNHNKVSKIQKNSLNQERLLNKYKNIKLQKDRQDKKNKSINTKKFKKLIKNQSSLDIFKFFKNNIDIQQQGKLIEEVKLLNNLSNVQKPYILELLEMIIPSQFKSLALKKINMMNSMDSSLGEYHKLKNWVDTFMTIPFNKFNNLPISFDNDGIDKCHEFMEACKTTLDKAVYGLNDAKMQIMQLIGQWLINPKAMGTAIAIKGPYGTGKTSLVKEGISKILNRPFNLIALGGATDSCFLEGHSYTYEGSTWGKIVDILIQSKTSNPIIFFDELDKVSDTPRGDEIIGILTHLIDTTQNSHFHDKYFSEIDFDLSKSLFIFSYNDESKINPILLDRMYRISTTGYNVKDKMQIATKYLLPVIKREIKFADEDIIIQEDVLKYIIEKFTDSESGVRNLKRCLEIIFSKLNLYRLMKPDVNLFDETLTLKVVFPLTLTMEQVDKLIVKEKELDLVWKGIYM